MAPCVSADHVQLAFVSPLGPAMLALGRKDSSTYGPSRAEELGSVATRANVMPEPGQAKLVFTNIGETEAMLRIDARTIKRAAGALPCRWIWQPGKYSYELSVPGRPATYEHPHRRGRRHLGAHRRARRRGMVAAPAVLTSPGSLNLTGSCRDFSSEAPPTVSQPLQSRAPKRRAASWRTNDGDDPARDASPGTLAAACMRSLPDGELLDRGRRRRGIVDVHALPQLEGAVEDTSRPDPYRVEYRVPSRGRVTLRGPRSC